VADADAGVAMPEQTQAIEAVVFGELAFGFEDGDARRGRWVAELLGRPIGSGYSYYLLLQDGGDFLIRYPAGAPSQLLRFKVLPPPL